MIDRIGKYYHTLKYLKWTQIRYRIQQVLLPSQSGKFSTESVPASRFLQLVEDIPAYAGWRVNDDFCFVNIIHSFPEEIDWNCFDYGILWRFNLNYFEFLHQPNMTKENGIRLIDDFIKKYDTLEGGRKAFPTSLRLTNWIKFICKHKIRNPLFDQSLWQQTQLLKKNIEFHLLGNHLLENAFGLLYSGVYFNDSDLTKIAVDILIPQLQEQILSDGGHFELSPMYHQLMLYRILDCINLIAHNAKKGQETLLTLLQDKAELMLGWMQEMKFQNGDLPKVNDSTDGIAPLPDALMEYANRLHLTPKKTSLGATGYRMIRKNNYEILVDVGAVGPDYIPGHAHSDTLSFVLHYQSEPLIVDTGISTYEKNERRTLERSTWSHNTVMVDGKEQSEVWGGFRVARRARITALIEEVDQITASHDGYKKIGVRHQRAFRFDDKKIILTDNLTGDKSGSAFLHFHPSVLVDLVDETITGRFGRIEFKNVQSIRLEVYQHAMGFNNTVPATKAIIDFKDQLITEIILD